MDRYERRAMKMLDANHSLRHVDAAFDAFARELTASAALMSDDRVARVLLNVMMEAHDRGISAYSAHYEASARKRSRRGSRAELKVDTVLKKLTAQERQALRKLYGAIASSATNRAMSHVRERMLKDIMKGNKGTKALREMRGDDVVRHVLKSVARTQASLSFAAAAWSRTAERADVWGYEYRTARDERVRAAHRRMDGVRYPTNHAFWVHYAPPNGWQCRCTLIPIYVGDKLARIKAFHGTPDVDEEFRFSPGRLIAV